MSDKWVNADKAIKICLNKEQKIVSFDNSNPLNLKLENGLD